MQSYSTTNPCRFVKLFLPFKNRAAITVIIPCNGSRLFSNIFSNRIINRATSRVHNHYGHRSRQLYFRCSRCYHEIHRFGGITVLGAQQYTLTAIRRLRLRPVTRGYEMPMNAYGLRYIITSLLYAVAIRLRADFVASRQIVSIMTPRVYGVRMHLRTSVHTERSFRRGMSRGPSTSGRSSFLFFLTEHVDC
jgi:ribosomal protein S26